MDEEENDDPNKVSLPQDTFSLMIVSKAGTSPWVAGFGIFALQMLLLVFVCWEMFFDGNFLAQFPLKVKLRVSITQFFVLLAIFFLQTDLVEAARSLSMVNNEHISNELISGLVEERGDIADEARERFVGTNRLKLTMAIITIAVSVALVVRSTTSLELLKEFAALMVITQLDNMAFKLFVKNGAFGLESKKKADEITTRSVIVDTTTPRGKYRMDVLIISLIYGLAVLGWFMILVLQLNGTIARSKGCDVEFDYLLGDGICDYEDYNTEICEWDGGDCKEVPGYPDCHVGFPSLIGDGDCHIVVGGGGAYTYASYNTEECGWDGGDCVRPEYPDCHVDFFPLTIGDGTCHGGAYNTEECGWDGGDCLVSGYPDCHVDNPSAIGDETCHVAHNTEECGWDGGDCNSDPFF